MSTTTKNETKKNKGSWFENFFKLHSQLKNIQNSKILNDDKRPEHHFFGKIII
jgi:hypothetical protein